MNEALEILKKTGTISSGSHFVGVSGRHFDTYIRKDALFPHTAETSRIGELLAEANQDLNIQIVIAPALGGIILSQWTAFHLSRLKGREVLSLFTEKTPEGGQVFKREYDRYIAGKKILVVEDAITTGGSVRKVVEEVKRLGGEVLRVSVIVNRDPDLVTSAAIGAPLQSLFNLRIPSYAAKDCPFCKAGKPINTVVGYGKQFLNI